MMSREIKFSYMYQHEDRGDIAECFYTLEEIENGVPHLDLETFGHRWFLAKRRQYTGLKDKNGKEIYEGDVLKRTPISEYSKEEICYVEWCDNCYSNVWSFHALDVKTHEHINSYYGEWYSDEFEIIGNIYENPELVNDEPN